LSRRFAFGDHGGRVAGPHLGDHDGSGEHHGPGDHDGPESHGTPDGHDEHLG
jgi:hypothetical protein